MKIRGALFVGFLVLSSAPTLARPDEKALLAEVDRTELERHATEIVRHVRPSGSSGERAAHDYVVTTLRSEAIPVEVHRFPAYVSDPIRASLERVGAGRATYTALTQSFAASTGPEGLVGELADGGKGRPEDYARVRAEGKIVLVDGGAAPDEVRRAVEAGAAGAVFVSSTERIHEMTVSPIWGTPTLADFQQLPAIPSVAVANSTGRALREALAEGPVRVRLVTGVATGWKTLRITVATVRSPKDPEGYVLVGGHMDAWHHGATDEGSANAAMVELARIFYRHRHELERGVKVAWWTGHSNGRYAGSTWYVDHFWTELKDNAVAYMNLDVIGQVGAKVYSAACTPGMDGLARSILRDLVGTEGTIRRPGRNSDQSFYGVGLPLLQFYHSRTEEEGGYWFWHTPEDTFDKIDFDNLVAETKLYVGALYRLTAAPLPPIHPTATAAELEQLLREKAGKVDDPDLSFDAVLERAERLSNLAASLEGQLPAGVDSLGAPELARRLIRFVRPVLRVLYEERGPYHPDPALPMKRLPGLSSLDTLAALEHDSDRYKFARTYLVRELNRIADHLDQALEEGERLAGDMAMPSAISR